MFCVGKGRWSPSISEYREATGGMPLTHAASQLLTAGAPAEVTMLTTAAEQLAVYGRYAKCRLMCCYMTYLAVPAHSCRGACR
jgi:hypothetical protein